MYIVGIHSDNNIMKWYYVSAYFSNNNMCTDQECMKITSLLIQYLLFVTDKVHYPAITKYDIDTNRAKRTCRSRIQMNKLLVMSGQL